MTMELVTIAFSHYNEKARWALDHYGVDYTERGYLPLIHMPFALATNRGLGQFGSASTPASTPILVTGTGTILCDSSDILKHLSGAFGTRETTLYPTKACAEIETELGRTIGFHARRAIYQFILKEPELTLEMARHNVDTWQVKVLETVGVSTFRRVMTKALKLSAEKADRSLGVVREAFDKASKQLSDGRPFLMGETFTAADLTLGSLGAPMLALQRSEGAKIWHLPPDQLPTTLRTLSGELRQTLAGQHILKLYKEMRQAHQPSK